MLTLCIALNSLSAVLLDTDFCLVDAHAIGPPLRKITKPLVDLWSSTSEAWSEST